MLRAAFFTLFLSTIYSSPTPAHAVIKLKLAVVNPSDTEEQTAPVRFDLPKGVDPKTILDMSEMELMYDFDKDTYYVFQMVTLKPGEKRVVEIRLQDIWAIPDKEIAYLKQHTQSLLKKLESTKHYKAGSGLAKKIMDKLDAIAKSQADAALSAGKKIDIYYENAALLNDLKGSIGMLENLVLDVGGMVEERVEVPKTLAVTLTPEEEAGEVIELNVKVSNPSKTSKQKTPFEYGLPEEVMPKHIVDSAGLDIAYDFNKECFRMFKSDLELSPAETKTFVIKIRDIWQIKDVETESFKAHTKNIIALLKDTEYMEKAKVLADKIFSGLESIAKSQSLKTTAAEHIAYYRANTGILENVKEAIAQLEKMATQSGTSPGVTVTEAEEVPGGGPEVKRKRGYEGIRLIAESIFRGKAPTPATTWKIIFTILVFVGLVGGLFFVLWYVQVKKRGGQ